VRQLLVSPFRTDCTGTDRRCFQVAAVAAGDPGESIMYVCASGAMKNSPWNCGIALTPCENWTVE
jgi:hypothetical protein